MSYKFSSWFHGISVSVLGSHLVKCLESKRRNHRHTYWCMYDTVFWMPFCIKTKLVQDYEYRYLLSFPLCFLLHYSFLCTYIVWYLSPAAAVQNYAFLVCYMTRKENESHNSQPPNWVSDQTFASHTSLIPVTSTLQLL